jgi:hypothetical protein
LNLIRSLALYLPQFHPIPENDRWWGKGFTEWTNVAKAKPLFEGHWQPRLPADLGFYDLRVPEVRTAQALLAKKYGIYGFCYWHYWFGGKQILERPLQEVVSSGEPDFPFCMAWANQTWKGTWHGLSNSRMLIEQTYPGNADHEAHFYTMLPAFVDKRYITVYGKKLFLVFMPLEIPDSRLFIDQWQTLAVKNGLNGFHFVAMHMPLDWDYRSYGFDAVLEDATPWKDHLVQNTSLSPKHFPKSLFSGTKRPSNGPRNVSYSAFLTEYPKNILNSHQYPLIYCDWDNTPRSGFDGWSFRDFDLSLFERQCMEAFIKTDNKTDEEKFVFIKSWNEWAEGNYLEPDTRFGHGYLEAFRSGYSRYKHEMDMKS